MLEPELHQELHPVDMLLDLVIAEELDPWDVDVEEIAGKFTRQVRQMMKLNLRLSGRTILAASVLLRIKSERFFEQEDGEEELYEPLEEAGEEPEYADPPAMREPLRRRVEKRTTIFEMVESLQLALKEELVRKNYPKRRKRRPRLVMEVDEKSIKEKMEKVYLKVKNLGSRERVVRFWELVEGSNRLELIETLLYLLYLDYEGKLRVWQDELFGEIFVALFREGEAS